MNLSRGGFLTVALINIFGYMATAQLPEIGVGEWRTHLSYNQPRVVEEADGRFYCGTKNGLFYINQQERSIHALSPIDGLSGIHVNALFYHNASNQLFIAYENGNIDIIQDESRIKTLNAIKQDNFIGRNVVTDFYLYNQKVYMPATFGVLAYDIELESFESTFFGPRDPKWATTGFTALKDTFYASTEEGLLKAPTNSPNLQDINNWETVKAYSQPGELATYKEKLYLERPNNILVYEKGNWDTLRQPDLSKAQKVDFKISRNNFLMAIRPKGIYQVTDQGVIDSLDLFFGSSAFSVISDKANNYWYTTNQFLINNRNGDLTYFSPEGPGAEDAWSIHYKADRVFVTAGGYRDNKAPSFKNAGFSVLKGSNNWEVFDQSSQDALSNNRITDITSLSILEQGNRYYATSYNKGVVEFRADSFHQLFTPANSPLDYIQGGGQSLRIPDATLDDQNNLWVVNYRATNALKVKTNEGEWYSYNLQGVNRVLEILIDDRDRIWLRKDNAGIVVFDHNGTLANKNDDLVRQLNTNDGRGGLPNKNVKSMAEDKEGNIWLGTADGVAVFYSPSPFTPSPNTPINAQQVFVQRGNQSGNLLTGEDVNAIAVDAGGYKWFGTSNGLFYTNPDGDKVLQNFNEANSPLIANNILSIGIQSNTGEVFLGTGQGLISYRGEATEGGDSHNDVYAYPNPVEPEYSGPVTVKGLVNNARIKITDGAGNLVQDMNAKGGQAVWNQENLHGHEVTSGVYYVYSTNEDGSETMVTKILLVQ